MVCSLTIYSLYGALYDAFIVLACRSHALTAGSVKSTFTYPLSLKHRFTDTAELVQPLTACFSITNFILVNDPRSIYLNRMAARGKRK